MRTAEPIDLAALPPVLRPVDIAPLLRTSPAGVRRLIREGVLPVIQLGRRILVPRAAVLRLLGEPGPNGGGGPDAA